MALPLPNIKPTKTGETTPKPSATESHPPKVDGFKIKGKLKKGKLKDLTSVLRSISFLEIAPEKDVLNVIYVENRDINKNPLLFSIAKIKEDEIEVLYTIPSEISPRKRRVDVIRYLLNILSLIDNSYEVQNKTVYQLIESSVEELSSSVNMDYAKLYTSYDTLKKDASDQRKKVNRLTEQVQALTTQNYELKTQNDELKLRIQELESLSENALKAKLQEWIAEHDGAINVIEFSKLYKVSEARIEEMLNRLVREGYLEVVK